MYGKTVQERKSLRNSICAKYFRPILLFEGEIYRSVLCCISLEPSTIYIRNTIETGATHTTALKVDIRPALQAALDEEAEEEEEDGLEMYPTHKRKGVRGGDQASRGLRLAGLLFPFFFSLSLYFSIYFSLLLLIPLFFFSFGSVRYM